MESKKQIDRLFNKASSLWDNRDHKKAFELFLEAAENGCPSSQLNIGYFYNEGIHVQKDFQKALHWYKKAYHQGEGSAANNIAIHYRRLKKYQKALWWFHKAVKMLDHDAYYEIAVMYEKGLGVKINTKKAKQYYNKAIRAYFVTENTVEKSYNLLNELNK